MPCLITGATGTVGRNLVDELLAAGEPVRALTRRPESAGLPEGVEIVAGDLAATESLPGSLFDDVRSVFVFPAEAGVARFVEQAADGGVQRFVLLSSLSAAGEHDRDHGSASNVHHLAIEQAVTATGRPTTILRPGTFANNLLAWAEPIKFTGRVQSPYPQSAQAPIHEADVAAVAAAALLRDDHDGRIYPMTGPEALTRVQQLDTIAAAIGRPLELEEISPREFAEQMRQYIPADIITMLLDYWRDTVGTPDVVLDTVVRVTGRPARTLARWAQDHAEDFGG